MRRGETLSRVISGDERVELLISTEKRMDFVVLRIEPATTASMAAPE